jgi:hypothetical protein
VGINHESSDCANRRCVMLYWIFARLTKTRERGSTAHGHSREVDLEWIVVHAVEERHVHRPASRRLAHRRQHARQVKGGGLATELLGERRRLVGLAGEVRPTALTGMGRGGEGRELNVRDSSMKGVAVAGVSDGIPLLEPRLLFDMSRQRLTFRYRMRWANGGASGTGTSATLRGGVGWIETFRLDSSTFHWR